MTGVELDPKAQKIQTIAKVGGTAVVAVAAAGVVTVAGASLAVAGTVALVGLAMVNFVVPVGARAIAIYKQKTLTAIAETFSEETIREDERREGDRIELLEEQYVTSRAELEGAQDELRKQLKDATPEEAAMLNAQIESLQSIIESAEDTLKARKEDYQELVRVNKMYIALNRSAAAMQKAQGADRNSEEMQRITTARAAIKNKMRAAMAGKTIEQMNSTLKLRGERVADVLPPGRS